MRLVEFNLGPGAGVWVQLLGCCKCVFQRF